MHALLLTLLLAVTPLAPLLGAKAWIGSAPTAESLAGKVVIVDVFTYSCINCQHVVPELRALRKRYSERDLAIIGIHTPELQSDYPRRNVVENLALQGITWPVAIDNDQRLWNAFGIDAWPTQLIYGRDGSLRKTIVGEGQDDLVSATVAALVARR